MKVLVCGSRSIEDPWFVIDELRNVDLDPDTVIHGDGSIVDETSETWAMTEGADVEVHPVPEWAWERIGKRSGPLRNSYMVSEADAIVAIWDGESSGTKDTVKKAEAEGLPVRKTVVDVDDDGLVEEVQYRRSSEGAQQTLTEYEQ